MTTREKIFNFIIEYKKAHDGNSPTIREIQAGCDISSTSVVNYNLTKLEQVGKIKLIGMLTRSIEVVGGQWLYGPDFTGEAQRLPANGDHTRRAIKAHYDRLKETLAA